MKTIPLENRYAGGDLTRVFDAVCMKSWLAAPSQTLVSTLMDELLKNIKNPSNADKPLIASAREIALLADESGVDNEYHNPHHVAIVTMMAAYFYMQSGEYIQHDYLLLLCCAAGHDLKHGGRANPTDSPIYNETISADLVCNVMDKNAVPPYYQRVSRGLIISTSTNGPHQFLQNKFTNGKFNEQYVIAERTRYMNLARILCDSDLFASAGTDLEISNIMSSRLNEESNKNGIEIDFTTPQSRAYFLDNVVGKDGFMSTVAQDIANKNFHELQTITAREIRLIKG